MLLIIAFICDIMFYISKNKYKKTNFLIYSKFYFLNKVSFSALSDRSIFKR